MSESRDMADRPRHRSLQRLLPAALLTCVVALYNHFPLTYPDTGGYLENAFALAQGRAPWFFYRPLTYGAFLIPFATPVPMWLGPVAPGFLIAILLDRHLPRRAGLAPRDAAPGRPSARPRRRRPPTGSWRSSQ